MESLWRKRRSFAPNVFDQDDDGKILSLAHRNNPMDIATEIFTTTTDGKSGGNRHSPILGADLS